MIRILIADDHTIVREGLKQILADTPDVEVKAEAGSAQEVMKRIKGKSFDLVLLDISLPGRSGLDVLKQLKCLRPDLPVLVLSMHPERKQQGKNQKQGKHPFTHRRPLHNNINLTMPSNMGE